MKTQLSSLIFLLFLGIAFGEQHCIDDSFGSSIIITNDYSGVEYYKVSYAVSSGAVLSLGENLGDGFFLMPKEQKIISYNVSLPFKGNYSLLFTITDSKAKTQTKSFNYEVIDCHNAEIKITSEGSNYCLRQSVPYKVIINNTGKYAENLSVMINSDSFNFSLSSGEYKEYNLEYYPTSLSENTIRVIASSANFRKSAEKKLNIRNCDTTAIIVDSLRLCPGQSINSNITLKNLGFSQDAYQILNSSDNIIINPEVFAVNPKEESIIPFTLISECGEIGLKNAYINIYSLNSGLINAKINYEALNCFDFKIEQKNFFNDYCEGENRTVFFNITNKGLMPDSYEGLLIYGGQQKSVSLSLNSKESVTLDISEHFNYSGDSKAELIIRSNNYCEKSNSFSQEFTVQKFSECYSAKLEVQEYFKGYSRVKITNNGSRINNYFLNVFNNSLISNMSFSLAPGQSKEYQLNNLDEIMKDYEISVFSVNLIGQGIDLTKQTSYSSSITGMIILSIKEYYSYAGLIILAILISLFAKNNILKQRKSNIKA